MKIPIKRKKSTKRHFQLLELMVAAFILLICIAPTMRIFTNIFKAQQEIIREYQRDHIAHMMHAKFTEELYKRTIPIDDFKEKNHISLAYPDLMKHLKEFHYDCSGTFSMIGKRKNDGNPSYLYSLEINVQDKLMKQKNEQSSSRRDSVSDKDPSVATYTYMVYIDTYADENEEEEDSDEGEDEDPDDDNDEEEEDEENEDEEDPDLQD